MQLAQSSGACTMQEDSETSVTLSWTTIPPKMFVSFGKNVQQYPRHKPRSYQSQWAHAMQEVPEFLGEQFPHQKVAEQRRTPFSVTQQVD